MRIYTKGMRLWDPVANQFVEIFNYIGSGLYLCIVSGILDDGELTNLGYCPVIESELDKMEESEVLR